MIRYNGMVLKPTGEFQTGEAGVVLVWWHYLLIAAGAVLLVMSCGTIVIIVAIALTKRKKSIPYEAALKVLLSWHVKSDV